MFAGGALDVRELLAGQIHRDQRVEVHVCLDRGGVRPLLGHRSRRTLRGRRPKRRAAKCGAAAIQAGYFGNRKVHCRRRFQSGPRIESGFTTL